MTRLHEYYKSTVQPKLAKDLDLKNPMQVPKITKITVNMRVGEAVADRKVVDAAAADMAKITGQKPLITKSKKADRIGIKTLADGKRVRFLKSNKEVLDVK